jgi:hypothetical protein
MKYMEVSGNYRTIATCSDDDCPCGFPGASIPKGEGYMYISEQVFDFRKDSLTEAEAKRKIDRMSAKMGSIITAGSGVFSPILMCGLGAKKRGIDLEVAAEDAKYWWQNGKVPLRVTPLAGSKRMVSSVKPGDKEKKWWQFWK